MDEKELWDYISQQEVKEETNQPQVRRLRNEDISEINFDCLFCDIKLK